MSISINYRQLPETDKNLIFVSHKEHKDGLYEKIFNNKTSFEDMLCAFYVFDVIDHGFADGTYLSYDNGFITPLYHSLALFKVAFTKYLQVKLDKTVNVNKYIIGLYERDEREVIIKTYKFINQFVNKQLEADNTEEEEKSIKFLSKPSYYEKIKDALEDLNISVEDIENIVLEDGDEIIQMDNSEN